MSKKKKKQFYAFMIDGDPEGYIPALSSVLDELAQVLVSLGFERVGGGPLENEFTSAEFWKAPGTVLLYPGQEEKT